MTVAALVLALISALCYALAAALQQHAAGQAETAGGVRLVAHLLTRPRWLAGVSAMVAGAGLHVVALSLGPLALVQPIGVTGLVFALPLGAALHGRRVTRSQVLAAAAVVGGLVAVLASVRVGVQPPYLSSAHGAVLAGVTAAGVAGSAVIGRRLPAASRAVAFAAGAGVAFGVTSALVRIIAVRVGEVGVAGALLDWPTLLLLAAAAAGMALAQSAYQAGSLASVQPTLEVVDPLAAITVGALLLGEPLQVSTAGAAVAAAGAAVLIVGTVALARHQAPSHPVPVPVPGPIPVLSPIPGTVSGVGGHPVVPAHPAPESESSQCA